MAKPRKASPKATKSKMDRAVREENKARDIARIPRIPKGAAANKKTKEVQRFNSPIDEGDKARFLHHLPKVEAGRKAVADATNALRTLYKTAKADSFVKADFDYAIGVSTPDKETATKEAIRRRLLIAKFMGSDLGAQLDMFSEPSRVPAVDRAYEEGQTASMQNKALNPPYVPSTLQYAKFVEGWHAHQAVLARGIKKTANKAANKATAAKTADKYTGPKVVVSNGGAGGFGMSEEEFAAEQAAAAPALAEHGFGDDDPAL